MNNKGVSFFWLTLYRVSQKKGNYSSDMTISNSTVVRLEGILNSQGRKIFCA